MDNKNNNDMNHKNKDMKSQNNANHSASSKAAGANHSASSRETTRK